MKTTMGMTRTFHPVGQGAFYTERFEAYNRGTFTIVYDCGSKTLSGDKLATRIRSTFPKGAEIEALFISHFHADHVNGLDILQKHCKIKRVVLPELGKEDIKLLEVLFAIDQEHGPNFNLSHDRFKTLVENPASFFGEGETQIITIKSISKGTPPNEGDLPESERDLRDGLHNANDLAKIKGNRTYESGSIFYYSHWEHWRFIPFNYAQDERRIQFEAALKKVRLRLSDMTSMEEINKHKDKLIKAYESIDGDLNVNSMILYSGPQYYRYRVNRILSCTRSFFDDYCYDYHTFPAGCLYTGDVNFNTTGMIGEVSERLGRVFCFLGTMQVPHHGSIHNFEKSILQMKHIRCAIFSFGSNNTYGHPSDLVVEEVVKEGVLPCLITEDPSSIVVQHIMY